MGRVVVAGSINTDLVVRVARFPVPGETLAGGSLAINGGGKGANQAVAAARMGAPVALVGAVGSDVFSQARVADLVAAGVDVGFVRRRDHVTGGVAVIQVDAAGQNTIVLVSGANDSVAAGDAADGVGAVLGREDVLVCQFELPLEATRAALRTARGIGAYSVLNAAPYLPEGRDLVELADTLIVNEVEAGQILGSAPVGVSDVPGAADRIAGLGPSVVVITVGAAGAYLRTPTTAALLPAPHVTVVDSTGAGDAFVGAFAALVAAGASIEEAARAGVATGSLAVQRPGAQPSLPFRREVDAFLARA